jgi:hypothetical protein
MVARRFALLNSARKLCRDRTTMATESAHWLLVRGRHNDARAEVTRLLAREPVYPKIVEFAADRRLALDVRQCRDSRFVRHHRPLLHQ